jgi:archaeal type IV pilus assembly protein PilA
MKKDAVSPVIATILMVAITVVLAAVLYVMVMGFGGQGGQETPTITMTYQKNTGSNYTFTVVGVTANDIKWTDITPVISGPASGAALNIPNSGNVGAGDASWFTYVTPGTYSITLKFNPTGSAAYSLSLTVA